MKDLLWKSLVLLAQFPAEDALIAHARCNSIDWVTIDGGAGTSTGGVYQVNGSIGQPDAGPTMSVGNFSVDGGFWSLIAAVQTPGAPTLTIKRIIHWMISGQKVSENSMNASGSERAIRRANWAISISVRAVC